MNYFELFDLTPGPAVDKTRIAKKYFELQKQNHPDFFTNASENEKEEALAISASINKGFGIFQNEDKTLEYYLESIGSLSSGEKYELPEGFLMEMMDFNEMVDEADVSTITGKADDYLKEMRNEVKYIFDMNQGDTLYEADISKLKEYYYKKKYIQRILDRLAD